MIFLAIDYGTKRIGVAVSHETLAEPLEIVGIERAVEDISDLVRSYNVDAIVLGISEGKIAEEAREFAKQLMEQLGDKIKLIEVDETLTSVETHAKLAQSGMPRGKRQQPIDHYAAAAILQDYLDVHGATL